MEIKFNKTLKLEAHFGCLQISHAKNFLLAILIDESD